MPGRVVRSEAALGGAVRVVTTNRSDGDFRIDGDPSRLAASRRAVVDLPWVWLRQVHGSRVVVADRASVSSVAGSAADAVVSADSGLALAVHTADCAPLALASADGTVIGAVHAGWRGLLAGVVESTVAAMRELGAGEVVASLGPCIHEECYEFGPSELDDVASAYGDEVRGETSSGRPALDLVVAARQAVMAARASWLAADDVCTACDGETYFSHRARGETGRMATVVWRVPSGETGTAHREGERQ